MNKPFMCLLMSLALALVARDLPAQNADAEGCKDSPLITRFPGSTISSCDNKEYEQAEVAVKDTDGSPIPKTVEGEYHSWDYVTREGLSEIQIFRNFETALKNAGFTLDYELPPAEITAHKANTWFHLSNRGSYYDQTIVITKDLQQEVTADAASLAKEINTAGHVAVYGIHFDTGKATILPDSEQTLTQIVQLFVENPDLKLRV